MATADLTDILEQAGVRYELLQHAHTETAFAEAEALGLPADEVAKTVVAKTPSGYVRAMLPASDRLDLHKLSELYGETKKNIRLATEEELAGEYPEFELGAVPPVGGARHDSVVVDSRLAERESVVFEAGSHEESLRVATTDLLRVANARVADISEE